MDPQANSQGAVAQNTTTQNQSQSINYHEAILPDGNIAMDKFKNYLPQDIRESEFFNKHKNIGDIAKAAVGLEKMLGGRIKIPDQNSSESERAEYYKKLGRPDDPSGYKFEFEGLPENYPVNKEYWGEIAKMAHKHGIPKSAMEGVFKEIIAADSKQFEAYNQKVAAHQEEVKAEATRKLAEIWGTQPETKQFVERNNMVNDYLKRNGAEHLIESSDPALRNMVYDIAKQTMESKMIGFEQNPTYSAAEAKQLAAKAMDTMNNGKTAFERQQAEKDFNKYISMF